jgi:DNA-binding GntR family transcriptional regulator
MGQVLDDVLGSENLSLARTSAVDQVAGRLRAMIADGRLPQGEHLREMPLADAFSVSRTTVRDAIRALAAEGLVTHEFHRGAIVTVLSDDDIADVYRVRRLLELSALAEMANGDDAAGERVEAALAACEAAAEAADYSGFVEGELAYHAAIVGYHGSPRIDQFFSNVLASLRLALSVLGADRRPSTTQTLARRYREIFDTARRGDIPAAQRLLGAHLDAYEARLRSSASK